MERMSKNVVDNVDFVECGTVWFAVGLKGKEMETVRISRKKKKKKEKWSILWDENFRTASP